MKKLIAKRPVLYLGRMYDKGDTLPANDQKMVTAWLNAKSAAWMVRRPRKADRRPRRAPDKRTGPRIARTGTGARRPRKTARRREWWRGTWTLTSWPP